MEGHLNLVKTEILEEERRVFPRFPFSYLTFKGEEEGDKTFEVKDISYSGLQLSLKDGGHSYIPGREINGELHWRQASLRAWGEVKWVKGRRLGVSFDESEKLLTAIKNFLSIENIVVAMRPLHCEKFDIELPANLLYWLRSDGPVEVFVWRHNDGEISHFEVIFFDSFVEWRDGVGLRSGKVLTQRDLDTPLGTEGEFVFQFDSTVDSEKLSFASDLVQHLQEGHLSAQGIEFLRRKLHPFSLEK